MNLPDGLLNSEWTLAMWALFLPVFLRAVRRAPWRRLADSAQLNVWLGMIVMLTLLWSMKAGVKPGLDLHLLGATVFTLAFGPELAFIGLCGVLAAVTVNGTGGWSEYAVNALLLAGVSVAISQAVLRFDERVLPQHFFVYIFANAFFGAALTVIGVGCAASLLLWAAGVYGFDYLGENYLPYFVLIGFAEAWLSGGAITLMVIYKPSWVGTFDDSRYLRNK